MNLDSTIESLIGAGVVDITFTRTSPEQGKQRPVVVAHQRVGAPSSMSSIEHYADAETWAGALAQVEHKVKHCARLIPHIDKN